MTKIMQTVLKPVRRNFNVGGFPFTASTVCKKFIRALTFEQDTLSGAPNHKICKLPNA
jgi:hypothetical protein